MLKQIVEIHRQVTWKDLWHCREGVQLLKGEVEPPYDAWTGVKNNIVQIWNKTDPKIRLLAGSDAPNYVMGFGLHREIENFAFMGHVYTGSTPQQARWRRSSQPQTEAGEFLTESSPYLIKTDQKYGGISVGTSADSDDGDFGNIVIIDGDPIGGDISNTQQIIEVVYHGKVIDRRDLQNEFCPRFGEFMKLLMERLLLRKDALPLRHPEPAVVP